MDEFLAKGEPLVLPPGFPQERETVVEQLEVLKSLRKVGTLKVGNPSNAKLESSSSKVQTSYANSRKEKTTSFVPNLKPNEIKNKSGTSTMLEKLQNASPYNIFFTRIPESPETIKHPNSITITDLLCPSLGKLRNSLQINFMIDIMWLMEQYEAQRVGYVNYTGYPMQAMLPYIFFRTKNVKKYLFTKVA